MAWDGWLVGHRTTVERRTGAVGRFPWRSVIVGAVAVTGLAWLAPGAGAVESARQGIPGYGYELVSPPSTAAQEPSVKAIGAFGEDVMFTSAGGFGDLTGLMPLGHFYRAKRTPSGWVTQSAGLPPIVDYPASAGISDWQANWWQVDRPLLMAGGEPRYVPDGPDNGNRTLIGAKDGEWNETNVPLPRGIDGGSGGSATAGDLSVLLESRVDRFPMTDGTEDTRNTGKSSLIVSGRRDDGTLDVRQIARQGGVTMLPSCEAVVGAPVNNGMKRGAVDRDGLERVVWSTSGTGCTTAARQRVYVTEPFSSNPDAFEISTSKCTVSCGAAATVRFAGASLDTDRIFMTTTQKLIDGDSNTMSDIYEYDFRRLAPDRLRLVTGDVAPANVLGVVAVSDSGSHMYFVARGALADAVTGDAAPVVGSPNLYVRIAPTAGGPAVTRFLATLDEADGIWAGGLATSTPDGRYLVMTSQAALTDDKQPGDVLPDVYRVEASTGQINRAWVTDPTHNGTLRSEGSTGPTTPAARTQPANTAIGRAPVRVAADGSVIAFTTKEPLVLGDENEREDLFVWTASDGAVSMVSDGRDPGGIPLYDGQMTPDGGAFVFTTRSQLVPQHTATSEGLYIYRRGGGFPVPPAPSAPCAGEACQGPLVGTPRLGDIGSSTFFGEGNAEPAGPVTPTVRVVGGQSSRGSMVRLRVRASVAGQIRIAGSGVRTTTRSVERAGTYIVAVRLSAKGTKSLKRKGRLKVSARVRLSDAAGRNATVSASLRYRATKDTPRSQPRTAGRRTERSGR